MSYRVTPTKGLVRPWALAFLPNRDILITERTGHLRLVRNGVLDPQEITGIPPVLQEKHRRNACQMASAWRCSGGDFLRVSIKRAGERYLIYLPVVL